MAVKVQFEIGHTSKLRSKKTPEGFTHDWELYVQGVNKAEISSFVDRVVFNLHESFPKPKRVVKEPPFILQESGYAGFLLDIDIHFKNRNEPKSVQYTYDLDLQQIGPPHHRSEIKKYIFEYPSEEFRQKLLKGGGVPVSGVIGGSISTPPNTALAVGDEGMVSKPKLSSGESKKFKSRTDEIKTNTYGNLFSAPTSKAGPSKAISDGKSNVGSKGSGPHTPTSVSSISSGVNASKEKQSKDKLSISQGTSSSGNMEKSREKSEKKKEHKQSSPNKEGRMEKKRLTPDNNKYDKRNEEKSKKDKSRDKERERSREKGGNLSGTKRPPSPKSNSREGDLNSKITSPQTQSHPRPLASASLNVDDAKAAMGKLEKESKRDQSSSSSGKKSKKDKKEKDKDKDKDREKDKRDDFKDKHRSGAEIKIKDDRFSNVANSLNLNSGGSDHSAGATQILAKDLKNSGLQPKKGDRELKAETSKSKPIDKPLDKTVGGSAASNISSLPGNMSNSSNDKKIPIPSNLTEKDKKSHKHKKKDKAKDKDKEKDKERDKDKEKDKVKGKEKDKDRSTEKGLDKPPEPNINTGVVESSRAETNNVRANSSLSASSNPNGSGNVNPITPTKKSQNKEKKSKEKSIKEEKRQRDPEPDTKNKKVKSAPSKISPAASGSSTNNNNTDISDIDSQQSTQDIPQKNNVSSLVGLKTPTQHSDSSNSSFPDLPPKSNSGSAISSVAADKKSQNLPASKDTKITGGNKEHRLRNNEKNNKAATTATKPDKESKKRKSTNSGLDTFVEPPLKQTKKDQIKATNEKSKSPSLRPSARAGDPGNAAFLPPPVNATATSMTTAPAVGTTTSSTLNSTQLAPPMHHPSSPALAADAVSNLSMISASGAAMPNSAAGNAATTTLPLEYLTELQELHHKIMTLQDGDELQQVVGMIAATGCYEITAKTFDFDLCKLDRLTVQRLQEFFSTSVS